MQGSFEDIYYRLVDKVRDDVYGVHDDIVVIDLLNESQLIQRDSISSINDTLVFDSDQFIDNIASSYANSAERIARQFALDFPRSKLYYNNKLVTNKDDIIGKFDSKIIMLCTQASLAFSFLLMGKVHNDAEHNKFVTSNKAIYHIITDDQCINLQLTGIYDVTDIDTNSKVSEINITTNLDGILKEYEYKFCKLGVICWSNI